jgi:hypothetical protein
MSSILGSLKLVNAKRQTSADPIQFRRLKVSEKIGHQISLATALKNGETYTVKRQRNVRDEASGLSTTVDVSRNVKQWWFVNTDTKKVAVQLRYGSRVIDFAKGKNAIEVSDGDELIQALTKLRDAVLGGELDAQIEIASEAVKARFKK